VRRHESAIRVRGLSLRLARITAPQSLFQQPWERGGESLSEGSMSGEYGIPGPSGASGGVYGDLPEDLGLVNLSPTEMMAWLYCPVSIPGRHEVILPDNLRRFWVLLEGVRARDPARFRSEYVYLTVKTLYVQGVANRPGWHTDGFGTGDLNFIWYDRAPTEFIEGELNLPEDCADSMALMTRYADGRRIVTYPAKHLLRLTPSVIHRAPEGFEPGMRTFIKVSISPDRYNLEGNSINHLLTGEWPMEKRQAARNHPAAWRDSPFPILPTALTAADTSDAELGPGRNSNDLA
jgi:hypothetical protein